jgi:hypothetical protein
MVKDFSGGFTEVTNEVGDNRMSGIINTKGEFVVPLKYELVGNEAKDYGVLYAFKDKSFTYWKTDGKTPFTNVPVYSIRFPPSYSVQVNKDLLVYMVPGETKQRGYLNRTGEVVIPPVFCDAGHFATNGLAVVKLCDGVSVPRAGNPTNPTPSGQSNQTGTSTKVADGEIILAEFRDAWYYPAKMVTVSGVQVLQYLDGTEFKMNNAKTRPYDWTVGTRLSCNWLNRGRFYPGKIAEVSADGKLHIHYDDGDKEWAEPGQCRCK